MPVFIRPARVEVTDGDGSGLGAAAAAIVALAVVISSAAVLLEDILTALAIAAAAAVLGSAGILAIVLRRHGVALVQTPPAPARAPDPGRAAVTAEAISAAPPAIEAPKIGNAIADFESATAPSEPRG